VICVCSRLRLIHACFVVYSAVVNKVRECHRFITYIKIVFSKSCRFKIMGQYYFLDAVVWKYFDDIALMNN
jgi:hypothetical protein